MAFCIVFSLESLKKEDGQPNPAVATVYNLISMQAKLVGHAIREGNLPDEVIYVDLISDQPETERDKIIEWLKFVDIELPRALRLGNDPIGDDTILAVFDDDRKRVEMWRQVGATCFQLSTPPLIVLPQAR